MKTKAAILYRLNEPLRIKEIEVPLLRRGQVLVRMSASGICRSQLNEIKGFKGSDSYLPHLMGHEGSGFVEALGKGVTKVRKGDFVVLSWIKGSGADVPSAQYRIGNLVINSGAVATLSEYSVVSENRLVRVSRKIPPDVAALLGCAVPTGAGMICNTLDAAKGKTIAVIGVGGIGAGAILAAKMRGCKRIIAVDVLREKLNFARRLGATGTVLCSGINFRNQIERLKKTTPVDYAVECSGSKEAMELTFELIRDTGTAVIAGNLKKGTDISIDPFELVKGKKIIGTWGGATRLDRDIPFYARNYLSGKLDLQRMITHRFHLKDINKAFLVLQSSRAGRVIITF